MVLIALKCPHCSGTIQMEDNLRTGFCVHCGSKVMNEQAVSGSVTIDRRPEIINQLKIAKEALLAHEWEKANKLVDNIFLMDYDCGDAWYMTALSNIRDKAAYDKTLGKIEAKKLNDYGIFSKDDIKKCWGDCNLSFSFKTLADDSFNAKALITIDGKESFSVGKNEVVVVGTHLGKHDLSVTLISTSSNGFGLDTLSFVASKDHAFVVKQKALSHLPKMTQTS